MKPFTVLMLTDYFPPHVGGGVEKVVDELSRRLADRGHAVTVLTLRTCPSPALERRGSLTIRRVPAWDLTERIGAQIALSVAVVPALWKAARDPAPDVVHAHNLFFRTTEAAVAPRVRAGRPLVTTLHLGAFAGGTRGLRLGFRAYEATVGRLVLRRSDHLVAVSAAVARHARALGCGRRPLTVIPNGVDTDIFRPPRTPPIGPPLLLFVGRLVANKGPEVFLEMAPAVLRRHPDASFCLVGEGPMRARLEAMAVRLGISERTRFLGLRDDVPDLLRRATALIRPSSTEGMPLVALEAMASGVPVVATPVGGTPEIVLDGISGYLAPVGDVDAFAAAVNRLLGDLGRARKMGQRGRGIARSHSWDSVVDRTERVYRTLLSAA